ncbi:hypothetical protein DFH27DRAFT_595948 [Peziza echinospora]|nr:hypothetical protein DFH27DRAFT_595948 [Peziza echinospora]
MEQSPLTQQARPSFRPKIVSLYETLFKEANTSVLGNGEKAAGFWAEFFLLKCHPPGLVELLGPLRSDDLMGLQPQTRELFLRCVSCVKAGVGPQDEVALETLTVFLRSILTKRYTNLSSDIISLLTGLDNVDKVFTGFVAALEGLVRNGRNIELRCKAIQTAMCIAYGAFQTGLLSYFTHRDFFPALMKFINDPEAVLITYDPFVLLGILANYNKFELQNPYQLRLSDFVNEPTIKKIIKEIGSASAQIRADYISVQEDLPEGWSLGGVLSYVGLSALSGIPKPKTPPPPTSAEAVKLAFDELPGNKAPILLPTYDFAHLNKLFLFQFVEFKEQGVEETPICAYISLTSYLLQHAHRSARSTAYARCNLLVFRILLEDQATCKNLVNEENKGPVRLCRQRQPHLPVVRGGRILMMVMIDVVIDGMNHNLRKRLDVDMYILCIAILQRILSYLIRTKTRLEYHWSELWRSILSFIKFLTTYVADLKDLPRITDLIHNLVNLVALSLSSGDNFLPGAAEYDDLFYKLVETGDGLKKFAEVYSLPTHLPQSSISILLAVSDHYYRLIAEFTTNAAAQARSKLASKNLSPAQVQEVIKKGYETLSIKSKEGLDGWERYREGLEERGFLKRFARWVVEDVRAGKGGGEV